MTVTAYHPERDFGIHVNYHTPLIMHDGTIEMTDVWRTDCFEKGYLIPMNDSGIIPEQIIKHSFK